MKTSASPKKPQADRRHGHGRTHAEDAARKRASRAENRDLALPGAPADSSRREACRLDLRAFCEVYGAARFPWPWSADHVEILASIQRAVLDGGLYLVVCPRGSGKSTMLEFACVWASAYGHRRYIVPICATGEDAATFLEAVKTVWESAEDLASDFPEIADAVRAVDGITLRARRLTIAGKPAHFDYSRERLVYPWHDDAAMAPGRGCIIEPRSITGRLRGMRHTLPDGAVVRPDLIIPDDIETHESARSPSQVRSRLRIMSADALGLAGPGVPIAGIALGTIGCRGCVIDTMLHDPAYHAWAGRKMQLVARWPDAQDTLWREYAAIRRRAADHKELEAKSAVYIEATAYYASHREAMDAGAAVMWPARKLATELSALQHAENLLIDRGADVFASEYQNDPQEDATTAAAVTVDAILGRLNRLPHWHIPVGCEKLAAKIDIGDERLHLVVLAAQPDGTPYLVHRQTWPERDTQALADLYPGMAPEARLWAALDALAAASVLPPRSRADGTAMHVERLHVDIGYRRAVVLRWCQQGAAAAIAVPEQGAKAEQTSGMANWKPRPGEHRGDGWLVRPAAHRSAKRVVVVDTHQWKSYAADRLLTPLGTPGALTLYGDTPAMHRVLAEHCTSEYGKSVSVNGGAPRTIWNMRPGRRDNHYWDCLVGAMVALSILGAQVKPGKDQAKPAPAKPRRAAPSSGFVRPARTGGGWMKH